ncbi:5-oxoprolinase subunit PxpB [Flavihumibacter profundi]|uniref:5-oxoprolinase subunit PxpB n=1 Tax=Flavihumibacter profundi TaxID=2716883 RepID=UPI001CC4F2AD|nr:5-oxoprolinase subunit PxpB [Flavihumibacter profundi]MBZ5859035.1 5-oxoprolinase subunit PxpB [Flavihumibacter profundi]
MSESALTLSYGTEISIDRHRELLGLLTEVRQTGFEGLLDVSIAYNSLSVFFDPGLVSRRYRQSPQAFVFQWLDELAARERVEVGPVMGKEHILPICYDPPFSPDLDTMAAFHNCSREEIIYLHQSQPYYVFMVGFSPGFPYLGIVPERLDTPRKATPALKVPAGSVGIAGRQTGIYPFESPGGWNIIGRTPIRMFNILDPDLCLLQAGDRVLFSPIDQQTFNYLNQYADT